MHSEEKKNKNKMHSEKVLILGHDSSSWFCDLEFDVCFVRTNKWVQINLHFF